MKGKQAVAAARRREGEAEGAKRLAEETARENARKVHDLESDLRRTAGVEAENRQLRHQLKLKTDPRVEKLQRRVLDLEAQVTELVHIRRQHQKLYEYTISLVQFAEKKTPWEAFELIADKLGIKGVTMIDGEYQKGLPASVVKMLQKKRGLR